jgi:hypothetical protein
MSYDPLSRDYAPKNPYSDSWRNATQPKEEYYGGQEQAIRGALGASVEKVRPQGNVTREVQQFEKHLNALICVIDELDRRLATATIPAPETNNSLRGSDSSGSALASQLSSFNNMLSHQINRLEAIYQGVDL